MLSKRAHTKKTFWNDGRENMRPPLPESPPEAARGPSVEVIIQRLFPFIKVPAFLFAPGAAAPEPRLPRWHEGPGTVASPTGGTGWRLGGAWPGSCRGVGVGYCCWIVAGADRSSHAEETSGPLPSRRVLSSSAHKRQIRKDNSSKPDL